MAMNNILGLFAQSPLKPLQKLSVKVTECSELLEPFFAATFQKIGTKLLKSVSKLLI
ncbi:phosphate transport regulator [Actinobacillus equuli]|nr:phosphate transport regulator [Actinobacillus equuli]